MYIMVREIMYYAGSLLVFRTASNEMLGEGFGMCVLKVRSIQPKT